MNKQQALPTRVSARVLARATATVAAKAAPVIHSKERLGAEAERSTEEASESASMLLEEEEAVDYHFVVFPSTRCHYSTKKYRERIAPITTSIYVFTNAVNLKRD